MSTIGQDGYRYVPERRSGTARRKARCDRSAKTPPVSGKDAKDNLCARAERLSASSLVTTRKKGKVARDRSRARRVLRNVARRRS